MSKNPWAWVIFNHKEQDAWKKLLNESERDPEPSPDWKAVKEGFKPDIWRKAQRLSKQTGKSVRKCYFWLNEGKKP